MLKGTQSSFTSVRGRGALSVLVPNPSVGTAAQQLLTWSEDLRVLELLFSPWRVLQKLLTVHLRLPWGIKVLERGQNIIRQQRCRSDGNCHSEAVSWRAASCGAAALASLHWFVSSGITFVSWYTILAWLHSFLWTSIFFCWVAETLETKDRLRWSQSRIFLFPDEIFVFHCEIPREEHLFSTFSLPNIQRFFMTVSKMNYILFPMLCLPSLLSLFFFFSWWKWVGYILRAVRVP